MVIKTLLGVCLSFALLTVSREVQAQDADKYKHATFAGGCFWCMEGPFEKIDGVISVISGYTGGSEKNPTYQEVSAGETTHLEAVDVTYDSTLVSYEQLLDIFWRSINPTQADGQFADIGAQYRTGIFYHDDEQKEIALKSREKLEQSNKFKEPIVTQLFKASVFYTAEEYHQDYYKKHPTHYKMYRYGSGRTPYLNKVWGTKK
ncbi:MAG: peptide methionine sulfoxide reductase msrA/msrB [Candidatus Omnitrophota bacterium]